MRYYYPDVDKYGPGEAYLWTDEHGRARSCKGVPVRGDQIENKTL